MSLWDDILQLRRDDRIPPEWKVAHLREHLTNPINALRSVPANQSISRDGRAIGNYVKRGSKPKAWRIGPPRSGVYRLVEDPSDDEVTQQAELQCATRLAEVALTRESRNEENLQHRASQERLKLPNQIRDGRTETVRGRNLQPRAPGAMKAVESVQGRPGRTRWAITHEFARWTVQSALRSGSPIKSRHDVYTALECLDFHFLFDTASGPIDRSQFLEWHRNAIRNLLQAEPRLNAGWAAKMIAVYLKTSCYLAGFGREGLEGVIHPPIDNVLISSLKKHFRQYPVIYAVLSTFRGIGSLTSDDYERLIDCFGRISEYEGCSLFEVEQYFQPS